MTTTKNPKYVYVLRVNDPENKSRNKTFQYPKKGTVTAPDWIPDPVCGRGLHGWENGEGDCLAADWHEDGVWLVLRVLESDLVRLNGKVKFKTGTVAHAGTKESATRYIWEETKAPRIIGLVLTGGDYSTLTGGDYSTLTGGDESVLCWRVWDGQRHRLHVRYTGEGGIESNKAYRFVNGEVVVV
jgi:hypothetical protein